MTDAMKIKFSGFSEEELEHYMKSLDPPGANRTI